MDETKACPYCGEDVLAAARKCRWCGEFFDAELRAERRSAGREDRGWSLPLAVPGLLILQGVLLIPLAAFCAASRAEEPVLTAGGILLVTAALYGVVGASSYGIGCRARILLIAGGNLIGGGLGVGTINALGIRPGPPSPLLASLGIGISLVSFAVAGFVLWTRRRTRMAAD